MSTGIAAAGEGLIYRYRRAREPAINDLTFRWPTGLTAVMGPNGAGKTTLLRILLAELKPQAGVLAVSSGRVGYVPQAADWPGGFTIMDFLTYCCWLQSVPRRTWSTRIDHALECLHLGPHREERLGSLSGGQHRRAMVAQSLLADPDLLILDEPSAGLDPRQRIHLRTLVAAIASDRAVVVATHLVEDVEQVAQHVTILDRGQTTFDGPMSGITDRWPALGSQSSLELAYLDLVPR